MSIILPRFTNSKTFLETPGGARVILKRRSESLVPGFWRRVGGGMGGVVVRDIRGRWWWWEEPWLVFGWRKSLVWVAADAAAAAATAPGGGRVLGWRWGSGKFRGGGRRRMRGWLVLSVCVCVEGEEGLW